MDRFQGMRVFARVARLGGFSAAARELRLSTTAVSRHVAQLEEHLRVRLLQRTTRRVSLTEAGQEYLERCERILADVEELEESLLEGRRSPRGRLRVSAGISFAQEQLNGLMPPFLERYPELEVELVLTDRKVDLVAEGIDLAVRISRMEDSSAFARRITICRHVLCAAPRYEARHGRPTRPAELSAHAHVIDTNHARRWWFEGPDGGEAVAPRGRYRVNGAHAARDAAIAGVGLAYLPTFVAGPAIEAGALHPQLPGYEGVELTLHALYPEGRYPTAGVRAFIDELVDRFGGGQPPWDGWRRRHQPSRSDGGR
jgi:DNA-binding transcriptional LysR family regulator